jgi:hypothetical protein
MRTATYETPGALRLNLEVPVGRIELETVEGTTTHVELEAVTGDMIEVVENARIDCRERGNGHEVVVEVQSRFGIFISFGRSQDIRLRVTCPPGADIEAQTKTADVHARGEYRSVVVKTASGDVDVEEAHVDARIKTASGDVHLGVVHGVVDVHTASGDLAIERAGGPAEQLRLVPGVGVGEEQQSAARSPRALGTRPRLAVPAGRRRSAVDHPGAGGAGQLTPAHGLTSRRVRAAGRRAAGRRRPRGRAAR